MLCAISGETPQDPVVSTKSGNLFSRRLIETYIAEHGTDPITSEPLTTDDLLPIQTSRGVAVAPRPPTQTSVPSLLSALQGEWDTLALESFELRQALGETRRELAAALYQNDAAVRVVARVTRERDEAREALSRVGVGAGAAGPQGQGEAMQIDGGAGSGGLPAEVVERIERVQEKLSKGRRKRAVPAGWPSKEDVASYEVLSKGEFGDTRFVAVNATGDIALVGGADGAAVVGVDKGDVVRRIAEGKTVVDGVWAGEKAVIAIAKEGVKVFQQEDEVASFAAEAGNATAHAGAVRGLAVHPTGDIIASVGEDKSFIVYDLQALKAVAQIHTELDLTACAFHPDGHLLALASPGTVTMYHTTTLAFAASFTLPSGPTFPTTSLSFNENGIWLAASSGPTVTVLDLRKEGAEAVVKTFDAASAASAAGRVAWDFSGQFLAAVSGEGVVVWAWVKKEKKWVEGVRSALAGRAVGWGAKGSRLVVGGAEGVVLLGGKE